MLSAVYIYIYIYIYRVCKGYTNTAKGSVFTVCLRLFGKKLLCTPVISVCHMGQPKSGSALSCMIYFILKHYVNVLMT